MHISWHKSRMEGHEIRDRRIRWIKAGVESSVGQALCAASGIGLITSYTGAITLSSALQHRVGSPQGYLDDGE